MTFLSRWAFSAVAVAALALTGCAAPHGAVRIGDLRPGSDAEEAAVKADPLAYLRESQRRAGALKQYHLTFCRQERLGLVPSLRPMERMAADFRVEPLSVRFVWDDPDSDYRECVFVRGRNDERVVLLPRHGLFGLPAQPAAFDPMDGVRFWKTRNPITDFGVHRMIVRTLKRIDDARAPVHYLGQRTVENTLARHFEITYPASDPFPSRRQDLFVEVARGLPLGTRLWLPGGEMDAQYLYLDVREADAPIPDSVFTIHMPAAKRSRSRAAEAPANPRFSPHFRAATVRERF